MNDGFRSYDAELTRVYLHDLEFDWLKGGAHQEGVTLAYWALSLHELRLELGLEQVATDALHRVVEGKHMDPLALGHVATRMHADHV